MTRIASEFSVTPYLQHPATNAMTILFFTTNACSATVRCWPADPEDGAVTQTVAAACVLAQDLVGTGHASDCPVWGGQYRHRVRFTELHPGTRYEYEVNLNIGSGGVYRNGFRTAPDRDTPVRFVAYSDSETVPSDFADETGYNHADEQGRSKEWGVLVDGVHRNLTYPVSRSEGYASNIVHMSAWEPDLILIAGDHVARGGVQLFWDEFWKENAGANGVGYNDPAGSTPIISALGNHDFYDNVGEPALKYQINRNGEFALKKYLTYFEFNSNGVDYANAPEAEKDSRDLSQLFHREDYGPVTLIFLDSNNTKDSSGNDTNTGLSRKGSVGARSPDLNPGSLQYTWFTNNLAEAQIKSRFTLVITHHCPYSSGSHIKARDSQCARPLQVLTDVMMRYGVDGWLCGHDEAQEHSQLHGVEIRPDGSSRTHVLNVYDLGSAGDGLKGEQKYKNTNAVYRAYSDSSDGLHYGHLRIEVKKSISGIWQCTMTPAYSYWSSDGTLRNELRLYPDAIVFNESGAVAYEQREHPGDSEPPPEEPLPVISAEAPEEVATVLGNTPLLRKVSSVAEYSDFKKWVDRGILYGRIQSQAVAMTNEMSYFSFAIDSPDLVLPEAVGDEGLTVDSVGFSDGAIQMKVSMKNLSVGASAKKAYLEKVFGVTGAEAPDAVFSSDNVKYRDDLKNNQDGTVTYSAAANAETPPARYFFRPSVTR